MKEAVYPGSSLFQNEEFEESIKMMGQGEFREVLPCTRTVPSEADRKSMLNAVSGNRDVVKLILKPGLPFQEHRRNCLWETWGWLVIISVIPSFPRFSITWKHFTIASLQINTSLA